MDVFVMHFLFLLIILYVLFRDARQSPVAFYQVFSSLVWIIISITLGNHSQILVSFCPSSSHHGFLTDWARALCCLTLRRWNISTLDCMVIHAPRSSMFFSGDHGTWRWITMLYFPAIYLLYCNIIHHQINNLLVNYPDTMLSTLVGIP